MHRYPLGLEHDVHFFELFKIYHASQYRYFPVFDPNFPRKITSFLANPEFLAELPIA